PPALPSFPTRRSSDLLAPYPIRFNYAASPTLDDIQTSMQAYEEVYGDYPALVVIDNVTNVVGDGDNAEDPFSGLESLMDYLATIDRKSTRLNSSHVKI